MLANMPFKFQFHKGTIKTKTLNNVFNWKSNFNSIKVRLKLLLILLPNQANVYFNSIKVRLKLHHTLIPLDYIQYFNSIKVRLKPTLLHLHHLPLPFQFHKGTIKTSQTSHLVFPIYISIP